MGFEPNRVNSTLLKDSLKNLGDPILVLEHNELLSTGGRPVLDFWPVHGVRDGGSGSCNRPGWISAELQDS